MAINRLQIRRDSRADFQTSASNPNNGEPLYVTDENRIRVGSQNATNLGKVQNSLPITEGIPFHGIWNCRAFGTADAVNVPAFNGAKANGDSTMEPLFTAFSGALPRYFGHDAGVVEVSASGDFLPGSTDPAMLFGFAIGTLEGDSDTLIGANGGYFTSILGNDNRTGKGYIEVSGGVGMMNALGDYNKPVLWNLDAKICFLGRDSVSSFKTSQEEMTWNAPADVIRQDEYTYRKGTDLDTAPVSSDDDNANVRVYGTLRVMDPFVMIGNNRKCSVLPGFSAAAYATFHNARTDAAPAGFDWNVYSDANQITVNSADEFPTAAKRGTIVGTGWGSFEAMGRVPGESFADIAGLASGSLAVLNTKLERFMNAVALGNMTAPGIGKHWTRWWRPRETVVDFSVEEYIPNLDNPNLFLKLKVGGPMQSDPAASYPAWNNADVSTVYLGSTGLLSPYSPASPYNAIGGFNCDFRWDYVSTDPAGANVCRSIDPGGQGTSYDYVCRYPHIHGVYNGTGSQADRIAHYIDEIDTQGAETWYYENPEATGNADGEWNCAWRRLSDDRRDHMRIHHSTAFAYGGRPGSNDFRPL